MSTNTLIPLAMKKKQPLDESGRTSVKLPADLHQKINIRSAESRKPIYTLIDEAWNCYQRYGGESTKEFPEVGTGKTAQVPLQYSSSHRELHVMLDTIVGSGNAAAVDMVQCLIEQFSRMVSGSSVRAPSSNPPVPEAPGIRPPSREAAIEEFSTEADKFADNAAEVGENARELGRDARKLRKDGGADPPRRKRLG